MKNILFLVFLCGFLGAKGQDLNHSAEKRSTSVVVRLDSVGIEDAYRMAANVLQDAGFVVAQSDPVLGMIATEFQKAPGFLVYQWKITASVRRSASGVDVYFKARTKDSLGEMQLEKRHNFGKDWANLEGLAAKMGGKLLFD